MYLGLICTNGARVLGAFLNPHHDLQEAGLKELILTRFQPFIGDINDDEQRCLSSSTFVDPDSAGECNALQAYSLSFYQLELWSMPANVPSDTNLIGDLESLAIAF